MTSEPTTIQISRRDRLRHMRMALSAGRFLARLPSAPLDKLFPGIEQLTISMRHEVRERALLYAEAYVLSLITAFLQPKRILEIGTATGQSTLLMARQAPDAEIDTLDLGSAPPALGVQADEPPWADLESIGAAFRGTEHEALITQHLGDSATFDYEPLAGAIDFVFVDGSHIYEYVRADSKNALRAIAPGGVVLWDDCNYLNPGVSKALHELRSAGTEVYRVHGTRFAVHRSPLSRE